MKAPLCRLTTLVATIALGITCLPAQASLPGGNGRLAYGSVRKGDDLEIVSSRSDGSRSKVLTKNNQSDICASWSPDGRRLLFCRFNPQDELFDLWVMNSDGSEKQNLTDTADEDEIFGAFSPDGQTIAYMRSTTGGSGYDLWLMSADGTDRRALTDTAEDEWRPSWAPDGRTIAFERDVLENGDLVSSDIWTVNVNNGQDTQLTDTGEIEFFADYSPNGNAITYASDTEGNLDIFVMDANGSNPRRVTFSPRNETAPVFSPDGTRIAFIAFSKDEETSNIFIIQADGSDRLKATNTAGREAAPSWQPV